MRDGIGAHIDYTCRTSNNRWRNTKPGNWFGCLHQQHHCRSRTQHSSTPSKPEQWSRVRGDAHHSTCKTVNRSSRYKRQERAFVPAARASPVLGSFRRIAFSLLLCVLGLAGIGSGLLIVRQCWEANACDGHSLDSRKQEHQTKSAFLTPDPGFVKPGIKKLEYAAERNILAESTHTH